jgi:antirestriction protein ArdC
MAYYKKSYNNDSRSSEDKALDRFADLMIERIKDIQTNWEKPWITTIGYPKNMSGRLYNGSNALMLMLHCEKEGYEVPVFATFERILSLNYDKNRTPLDMPNVGVLKGERSFPVYLTTFTVLEKNTKEKIKYDDYKMLTKEEKANYNVYPKLQIYNVFNLVAQTNLKDTRPDMYMKLLSENGVNRSDNIVSEVSLPAMDEMIKHNLWYCPIKLKYQDKAYYSVGDDVIVLPKRSQFIDTQSFYGTAWHEMSHSLSAEKRLNRLKPCAFGSADYSREELQAELSAAMVGARYGMTKNIKADSASYLKAWLDNLQESPEYIKTVLQDVKKSYAMITNRIDKIQNYINEYKESIGSNDLYPDFYNIDFNEEIAGAVSQETATISDARIDTFRRGR